ncbi:MAG: FecR family protein [Bdellovibrionota bacterium]
MIATLIFVSASAFADEAPAAHAVTIEGNVRARAGDSATSQARELRAGDAVNEGETIVTEAKSAAKFLLADQTIVDLGASTSLRVEELKLHHGADRQVALNLNYGRVRTLVSRPVGASGRFIVQHHASIFGVRGTEFVLEAKPGSEEARLTVLQGKVEWSSPGPKGERVSVLVPAGAQLASGETTPLSSEKELLAARQARISDRTFREDLVVADEKSSPSRADLAVGTLTATPLPILAAATLVFQPKITDLGLPGTFAPGIPVPLGSTFLPPLFQGGGPAPTARVAVGFQ